MSFVHLHCHSEYSLLDGANRIDDLIRRAREFEQPALAITDHGNLHAAWELQERAKKAGIKPIIGMEAYVAPGDRRTKSRAAPKDKPYYHLVLLARDAVGYRNLVKLSSLAYTEGFYSKPRVDRELLAQYNEGLIVSSACLAGEVARHLMAGDTSGARAVAAWYAETFRDRYYLEVQAHASEGQAELNRQIFQLATDVGLPVIATNDAHFLRGEDHDAHDILLCIGLGKDRSDPDRMRYDRGLYFKSAPEIASQFPDRPDVLENTLRIADQVNVGFEKTYHVPAFPLPSGVASENELLTTLATAGAKERYGDPLPAHVRERLDYELGVITTTGYAGYFLIVADFIKAARDRGIPVGPGRGSAAGSLVAYSLRITNICPLKYDLLFERFLNPERVSMPDIDVDFCFERRGEVIEYVRQKYGKESVCQIVTFGTMKSRAAIKDVGRTLGFTPAETDALAKLIPNQPNYSLTVKEAVEQIGEVRKLYGSDERYRQMLDYAIALEGLSRHTGVHAAGVVIAPGPVSDYVPICTQASKGAGSSSDDEAVVVSQYDMNCLEKAGMLKIDFLGLTTLTVIHDALESIAARSAAGGGERIDIDAIPLDDAPVYQMIRAGRTIGVFQFESPLATDMLRGMRCDSFNDLVASTALMRPGPLDAGMHRVYMRRKRGEESVAFALPELETILEPTYGVITYQEQVMRIAQVLAGMSIAEADVLRKAVGKKDAELLKHELGGFIERSVARGYDRRIIEELAGQIETFGRYGFVKAHAVAYSIISYQTAWLKAHHPADFMAALLSSSIGDTDNVVKYINEARELGIEVLPPDVNESGYKFTVVGDRRVRFGLGAIRNVGRSAIDSILGARAERPFASFFEFCERIDLRLCNKRVLEALIASGAVDGLDGHRAQYWAVLDTAIQEASLKQQEAASGQFSLLSMNEEPGETSVQQARALPSLAPLSESERLTKEKEILGFYISGHPLEPFRVECEIFATHQVAELGHWTDQPLALGVVITAVKRQISKRSGADFARLTVEDFSGSAEVLIFPEAWTLLGPKVRTDIPVLLKGAYSRRDQEADNPTFIVESLTPLVELRLTGQVAISIDLGPLAGLNADVMRDVRAAVDLHATGHAGAPAIELRWADEGGAPLRLRSRSLRMAPSQPALTDLRALLGGDRVRLVRSSPAAAAPNGGGRDMGTSVTLEFEKPIAELEKQIEELKKLAGDRQLDVAGEIAPLERKLSELRDEIYRNLTPWQRVQVARSSKRPFTLDYLRLAFTDFIELHGDRAFREDAAIVGGWARLDGDTVMVIGHQRGRDTKEILKRNFGMPHPEGYRKALRLMKLAEKFHAPVITLVDTMGAWAGLGAEERGQSEAIARNLFEMSRLEVPIIATIIGEGGSGGALALAVADRTNMLENAVYSVISVEGCATILWKDGKSPEMREKAASALRITARDLLDLHVIDEIIPEPPGGAHANHEATAQSVHDTLVRQLEDLRRHKPDKLLRRRRERYLRLGQFSE